MVQILQRNDPFQMLGAGLGTGISGGLQQLANQKIQDLQAKQLVPGLQTIFPNYNQSQLESLARQDPRILNQLIKQQTALRSEEPINQAVENIISGQQQNMPDQLSVLLGQLSPSNQPQTVQQQLQKTPEEQFATRIPQKVLSSPATLSTKLPPGALAAQEEARLEDYISLGKLSPAQADKVREKFEKRTDRYEKQQEKIDKSTEEWNKDISNKKTAALDSNTELQVMRNAIASGTLPNPTTASILNTLEHGIGGYVGINLKPMFYSKEAQEFEKTATGFSKFAKQFFGARITEGEVNIILKTVPSLLNSDEGKIKLIENIERMNNVNIDAANIRDRIIEENGGYRPRNIESLVSKEIDKMKDNIKKNLIEEGKKAYGGSHRAERIAKKALVTPLGAAGGAALGSFFGPAGTAIGAGLGGLAGLLKE